MFTGLGVTGKFSIEVTGFCDAVKIVNSLDITSVFVFFSNIGSGFIILVVFVSEYIFGCMLIICSETGSFEICDSNNVCEILACSLRILEVSSIVEVCVSKVSVFEVSVSLIIDSIVLPFFLHLFLE